MKEQNKDKDKALLKYVERESWIFTEKYRNQSIEVYGDIFLYLDISFSVSLFFPNKQTKNTNTRHNKHKEERRKKKVYSVTT